MAPTRDRPTNDIGKIEWYKELVTERDYKWFAKDGEINIIGLRGYSLLKGHHSNKPDYDNEGKFKGRLYDDTIAFIWYDEGKANIKEFEATTDPGVVHRPNKPNTYIVHLVPGQHHYRRGKHKKSEGRANPAVVKKASKKGVEITDIRIYINYLKDQFEKKTDNELFRHLRKEWKIPQKTKIKEYIIENAGIKFKAMKDIPAKYKYNQKINAWVDRNQNGIIDDKEKKHHYGKGLNIHQGGLYSRKYVGDYSEGCQVINMIPYKEIQRKEHEIEQRLKDKYVQEFNKYINNIPKNGIIGEHRLVKIKGFLVERFVNKNKNVDIPQIDKPKYESWEKRVRRKIDREKKHAFRKEKNKWFNEMDSQKRSRFNREISPLFEKSKSDRFSYVLIDLSI